MRSLNMAKAKQKSIAELDQKEWNERLWQVLKKEYADKDAVQEILMDEALWRTAAGFLRNYVDPDRTAELYRTRKQRGAAYKRQLEMAIAGLNAAAGLLAAKGGDARVLEVTALARQFGEELGRAEEAYATKRHGRDRAHMVLYICQQFLAAGLKKPVTFVTLADLVNAADMVQESSAKTVTEEQIRKNFNNLHKNSPLIRGLVEQQDLANF